MTAPVNLNKMRKARGRAAAKARADENAARHGRTKAERAALATREDRAATLLNGHKLDRDDTRG